MDHPIKPLLTPDFVVRSLHLKVPVLPRPYLPFSCITTDSRRISPGCLFVALKGEKFDGNEFVENAIAQGARGVLCRRGVSISATKDICVFPVEDPLASYRRMAAAWRREYSIPIMAIAGSAGKTTTKELLAAILRGKWSYVLKTHGSQNGFVGIPMTLLELRPEHGAAVIEVGIDEIGTMQQHMALIHPTASVLTAIGPEHLEKLQDIPTVAREEGIALSHVSRSGGMVAINLDDPWIKPHLVTLREGRRVPYSLNGAQSSIDMIQGQIISNGRQLKFAGLGIGETTIELPLPGQHNAQNLLAAITLAAGLGLSGAEIQIGLKHFKGAEGRSEVRELPGRVTAICDYYNAQPASVTAALQLLTQMAQQGDNPRSRWVCLGDMLELGPQEERYHRDIAPLLIELKIENVLLFGPRMTALDDELKKLGFQGFRAHFATHSDLTGALTKRINPGDILLIKGSRGMKMEEIWRILEPYAVTHWNKEFEGRNTSPEP